MPVERIATRGFANTPASACPIAAIAPTRLGDSRSPATTARSPAAMSAPRRLTCCPAVAAEKISISIPCVSVSSTITTASAPAGSGAPVAISAQVPGSIVIDDIWPV